MILLIDNYDSFVHNLARYLERLGQRTLVARNDRIDAQAVAALGPRAVVISPGPGTPREAGCSLEVVRRLHGQVPILGVCLGHQAIGEALGGRVVRAREPKHGAASLVRHTGEGPLAGLPNPLVAGRYHSLVLDSGSLPADLRPIAWCEHGDLMAIAHRQFPVFGVQFHPESILTPDGYQLLANFLRIAGLSVTDPPPTIDDELQRPTPTP